MKIRVLEAQVAAKIAAGEVIERPASVAKELIENSLDAGARQIVIEVRGGGTDLLRVVDNGSGLSQDNVELAFRRHATSKLTTSEDLETISTLGFRGEALPSIAAVSHVQMVTRDKDSQAGWGITLRCGKVENAGPQGAPPGTSVMVSQLFEDFPARRKFLRSSVAEGGRVSDMVSRFILAFPDVKFQLSVEGRQVFKSSGSGSLEEALSVVYGTDISEQMLIVGQDSSSINNIVYGFVSPVSLSRSNRSQITWLINRRWVQSRTLAVALTEAYHGLLPQGRHPISVLNITMANTDVDVNVHPMKREVRFREESRMFVAVQKVVRSVLIANSPVPRIYVQPTATADNILLNPDARFTSSIESVRDSQPEASTQNAKSLSAIASTLRVLGQARNTYVVADGPDGIFLLDQHAAHECVLYEKVLDELDQNRPSIQTLMEPVILQLSPSQLELVEESREELEIQGFILEPFGGHSVLLRAVPAIFREADPGRGLSEVLDMVANEGGPKGRREILAASTACHSSVRAGMSLSLQEMNEMVASLEKSKSPHTCPHGRPTMLHLSSDHLERSFGRR